MSVLYLSQLDAKLGFLCSAHLVQRKLFTTIKAFIVSINMKKISEKGCLSTIYRTKEGLILKLPWIGGDKRYRAEVADNFVVEK